MNTHFLKLTETHDIKNRILVNFIKSHLLSDEQFSGCRFVTVDAYNDKSVIDSYTRMGFTFIQDSDKDDVTRCMYLDITK